MKKNPRAFSLIELSIVILIIGIVIAGVTSGSILVGKMRLAGARSITNSSPISSIKDLAFWLDSTSESSFIESQQEDGQKITAWNDLNPQSIKKINLEQSDSSLQPLFKNNSINNLPTLLFDGSDDYLSTDANFLLGDAIEKDQVTFFIVMKYMYDEGSQCNTPIIAAIDDNALVRTSMHLACGGVIYFDFGQCCDNNVGRLSTSNNTYLQKPIIATYVIKNATGTLRINGNPILNAQTLTNNLSNSDLTSADSFLRIGGSSGVYLNCYVGEFAIFRRGLKQNEIKEIETYLSKKWGIVLEEVN